MAITTPDQRRAAMLGGALPIPDSDISRQDRRQVAWEFRRPIRGFKKNNPGCNCCVGEDCDHCQANTTTNQWQVEFGGSIADDLCSDCADWLTPTYTLTRLGKTCTWRVLFAPPCSDVGCIGPGKGIQMSISATTIYLMVMNDIATTIAGIPLTLCFDGFLGREADFEKAITATIDCGTSHVLAFKSQLVDAGPYVGTNCDWSSVTCTVTPL